jgi:hypothetical protein
VHKAPNGHQTTCEKNHGIDYGSLETCLWNQHLLHSHSRSTPLKKI